jgi:hypothetical protein
MDKERQIRFLYPAFILIASFLVGVYLDPCKSISDLLPVTDSELKSSDIVAVLVGGGVFILVLGFLIGTLTVNILRVGFFLFGHRNYEIVLPDDAYDRILRFIDWPNNQIQPRERFYAAVTFDHEILSNGIHDWIVRRWNAFYVSANSILALILAPVIGLSLSVHLTFWWILLTAVTSILILLNCITAWRETMRMLEFQSRRNKIPKQQQATSVDSDSVANAI